MNGADISKIRSSAILKQFEELTCKQVSNNCLQAMNSLITSHPDLSSQLLHIALIKQRLDLIAIIVKNSPQPEPLKIINYICKHMNQFQEKQVSLIWNLLYIQNSSPHKYEIFYECLVTFPFGGANREAQRTSLFVLCELIDLIFKRADNRILSRICDNYMENFKKYNILDVNYFRVMNKVLSVSSSFEGFVKVDVHQILNRYLKHLSLAKQKTWHNMEIEILKGVKILGDNLFQSEYIVGSIFSVVLFNISPYLEDKVFGVRDSAREAIKSWKKVEKRVQTERKDKEKILSQQERFNIIQEFQEKPKIISMIEDTGKYLAKKQYAQKRVFNDLSSKISDSIQRKSSFLRRKTGNGGGYISLQQKPKMNRIKNKYQQILDNIVLKQKSIKEVPSDELQEYEWYPNNSHITGKYDLQQTIEYQNSESFILDMMTKQKSQKSDFTIKQIQDLIDLAYAKIK